MRAAALKDCSQPAQMNQQNPTPQAPASDVRAARTARLEVARAELRAATERGEGGRVALKQYSQRMDAIIQQLFVEAAAGAVQPVGVFALGGYGRRQLCLHSDIDVLILFAGPLWPEDETASTMMSRLTSRKSSKPSPSRWTTPGRKLSAATSDAATSRLARLTPSGFFRLIRTDSLVEATWSNVAGPIRP